MVQLALYVNIISVTSTIIHLAMSRPLRTDIPHVLSTLILEWSYITSFCQKDAEMKRKHKADYDRCR